MAWPCLYFYLVATCGIAATKTCPAAEMDFHVVRQTHHGCMKIKMTLKLGLSRAKISPLPPGGCLACSGLYTLNVLKIFSTLLIGHKYFHTGYEFHATKCNALIFLGFFRLVFTNLRTDASTTHDGWQIHYLWFSAPSTAWQTRSKI